MPFPGRLGKHSRHSNDTSSNNDVFNKSTPSRLTAEDKARYAEESELSPRSRPSSRNRPLANAASEIAPWDSEPPPEPHGTQGAPLTGVRSVEDFPEPQWASMSQSSNGDLSPTRSPSFPTMHPGNASDGAWDTDAGANTRSQGSDASHTNGKSLGKVASFFGENPTDSKSSHLRPPGHSISDANGNGTKLENVRSSSSSTGNKKSIPGSSNSSRPRTPPQASSEVTPWAFQDSADIDTFGDAPVRGDPIGPDRERYADRRQSTFPLRKESTAHGHHKFSIHRHRNQKSTGSNDTDGGSFSMNRRETQPSFGSMRHLSTFTSSTSRDSRPGSSADQDSPHTPESRGPKRSIIDKIRGRHKDSKDETNSIKSGTGSEVSLPLQGDPPRSSDARNLSGSKEFNGAPLGPELTRTVTSQSRQSVSLASGKKDHHSRLPFKKRGPSADQQTPTSDPTPSTDARANPNLWQLDTDLSQMDDIVAHQPKVSTPGYIGAQSFGQNRSMEPSNPFDTPGGWDAPDSWAIKEDNANAGKLQELDENGGAPLEEDDGLLYGIRIFKADAVGTFVTMTLKLSTTSAEIVHLMAKKSNVADDIDNYHIVMRKHHTSRQLEPGERPLLLQRQLLEQAGYRNYDHLESLGREDHSYLCRFSFTHAKMSGYASIDQDLNLNKTHRHTNVNLRGRNLITIPLSLYHKCNEIQGIDLSRNIAINVPKDFIQQCSNLKDIKFCSNEAVRLPVSLALAPKLLYLDVSNNRLEDLEPANLSRIEGLAALTLANNRLARLPDSFSSFKSMRRLQMSSNSFDYIPEAVLGMESLTDLDVSFNQISDFSDIGRLRQLRRLYATNNKLSGPLNSSMTSLSCLDELDVRFNKIDNIDVCSQLPQLEVLSAGHNLIAAFEGSLPRIQRLLLDHNPITHFSLKTESPALSILNLASAQLAHLPDDLSLMMPNLMELNLNKNHFVSISPQVGRLQKLEQLSMAKNSLEKIPPDIGRLAALRVLNIRENNMLTLPQELWFCRSLQVLNASCNVLESFPKPPTSIPQSMTATPPQTSSNTTSDPPTPGGADADEDSEERDKLSDFNLNRRGSHMSSTLGSDSSGTTSTRKNSLASIVGTTHPRKGSMLNTPMLSRSSTETTLQSRKDSVVLNRTTDMFAGSLKCLYLAENRLQDEVFDQVGILQELEILNLSYNELDDLSVCNFRKLSKLQELHLSQNSLTSLPSEQLVELANLRVLLINGNRFAVLPAELAKMTKLSVLDASSNYLKYNVSNWPYDWNWNANPQLRYLSLSGNTRLEIKPPTHHHANASRDDPTSTTDFDSLSRLRILGLMDVTVLINSIPDNTADRRVRTAGSQIGSMPYGIADSLGSCEHLSTMDLVVPRLEGHADETLFGLFDAMPHPHHGSRSAKYLQNHFEQVMKQELQRTRDNGEPAGDALRRTYLTLNRNLLTMATQPSDTKTRRSDPRDFSTLTQEDLDYGCVATMMYIHGMELFVSNVGDAQAMLIQSNSGYRFLTEKHDPASMTERERIRAAGGYVSRQGKLNDELTVSRAFGFTHLLPAVVAAPHVLATSIEDTDEIILIASRELWDHLTPDFVVDQARSERGDLPRAAQKLRDLAIAFGAHGKITVMMVGVSDLRKRDKARVRSHSLSLGPSGLSDDYIATKAQARRPKRGRGDTAIDSKLARLDNEVDAPVGEVTLIFTDIKSSTQLWDLFPTAMRSAVKQHNELFRRQLRLIGGYEVKTEGDAFMVAFPSVTSALLWAFTCQMQLLEVPWPQEILHSAIGQEERDPDGNLLFRGISVRMGIHWGQPVCETDPVTRRMDYFGPMVNKSARISGIADGGQITVSADFIGEIQKLLETHMESDRSDSMGSEDQMEQDMATANIQRELRSLSSHGFEVKDLGERRLKGLEQLEYIYLLYPHALAARLPFVEQREAAAKAAESAASKAKGLNLSVDLDNVWGLWNVSLRLEMLCSSLETPSASKLRPPETALLDMTKERGEVITEKFLLGFAEHQISRIETCINSLMLRNIVRPFKDGMFEAACPMGDIFADLASQLEELKAYKENNDIDMAPS